MVWEQCRVCRGHTQKRAEVADTDDDEPLTSPKMEAGNAVAHSRINATAFSAFEYCCARDRARSASSNLPSAANTASLNATCTSSSAFSLRSFPEVSEPMLAGGGVSTAVPPL